MNDEALGFANASAQAEQDAQALRWQFLTWLRAAEQRDWQALQSMIDLDEIYVFGAPHAWEDLAELLERRCDEVCDLEVSPGETHEKVLRSGAIRLSTRLRVFWTSNADWEEGRADLMVHAVFRLGRAVAAVTHVTIERAVDAVPDQPVAAAPAPADLPDPVPMSSPSKSPEEEADKAVRYFARDASAAAPAAAPAGSGKRHLVYMPVLMDGDVLRDLLK